MKTFWSTLAAILVAAAVISEVKSYEDSIARSEAIKRETASYEEDAKITKKVQEFEGQMDAKYQEEQRKKDPGRDARLDAYFRQPVDEHGRAIERPR